MLRREFMGTALAAATATHAVKTGDQQRKAEKILDNALPKACETLVELLMPKNAPEVRLAAAKIILDCALAPLFVVEAAKVDRAKGVL